MPLTDVKIRNLKRQDKTYKLSDGGGLFLLIKPIGKYWRYSYRFNGKQKTLSIGVYPEIPLKKARQKHAEARLLLADGIDPSAHKQAQKQARKAEALNSFEALAREWHSKQVPHWSEKHAHILLRRLEANVFPWLGNRPPGQIKPPEVLQVLRKVEARGAVDTAHRVLQVCGQVFRYAVAIGLADSDPCRDLRGALSKVRGSHYASITEPIKIGPLLQALHAYQGRFITCCALQFLPLVFTRPGELRNARWDEIDFDKALWLIPAHKMKMKTDHLVPLSKQALSILEKLKPVTARHSPYVFHAMHQRQQPLSDNTLNTALRRMGYSKDEMSAHGFRAMARTNLDEILGYRIEAIEMQLAHAVRDANGRAYNRTQYLDERREMMQAWADWLDGLQASVND